VRSQLCALSPGPTKSLSERGNASWGICCCVRAPTLSQESRESFHTCRKLSFQWSCLSVPFGGAHPPLIPSYFRSRTSGVSAGGTAPWVIAIHAHSRGTVVARSAIRSQAGRVPMSGAANNLKQIGLGDSQLPRPLFQNISRRMTGSSSYSVQARILPRMEQAGLKSAVDSIN